MDFIPQKIYFLWNETHKSKVFASIFGNGSVNILTKKLPA